jgi:hypothetical protein
MANVQMVSLVNRYDNLGHTDLGIVCGFIGFGSDSWNYYAAHFN